MKQETHPEMPSQKPVLRIYLGNQLEAVKKILDGQAP